MAPHRVRLGFCRRTPSYGGRENSTCSERKRKVAKPTESLIVDESQSLFFPSRAPITVRNMRFAGVDPRVGG